MRRNVRSSKVIRAIAIGLATMIAATSMPVTVIADTGSDSSLNEGSDTSSESSEEVAEVTEAAEAAETVSSDSGEDVSQISDSNDATQAAVGSLGEYAAIPEQDLTIGGQQYIIPAEPMPDVETIDMLAGTLETKVEGIEANTQNTLATVDEKMTGLCEQVEVMTGENEAVKDVSEMANSASIAIKSVNDNNTVLSDISDASEATEAASAAIEQAETIEEINAVVEDIKDLADAAEQELKTLSDAAAVAKEKYDAAVIDLDLAETNYKNALEAAKQNRKDAQDLLTEALRELSEAKAAAEELRKKAAEAESERVEAAAEAAEMAEAALQAAKDAEDRAKEIFDEKAGPYNSAKADLDKKLDGYVSVEAMKNAAADDVGMSMIFANAKRGAYFWGNGDVFNDIYIDDHVLYSLSLITIALEARTLLETGLFDGAVDDYEIKGEYNTDNISYYTTITLKDGSKVESTTFCKNGFGIDYVDVIYKGKSVYAYREQLIDILERFKYGQYANPYDNPYGDKYERLKSKIPAAENAQKALDVLKPDYNDANKTYKDAKALSAKLTNDVASYNATISSDSLYTSIKDAAKTESEKIAALEKKVDDLKKLIDGIDLDKIKDEQAFAAAANQVQALKQQLDLADSALSQARNAKSVLDSKIVTLEGEATDKIDRIEAAKEEARMKAEEEARKKVEEEDRKKAEEESRKKAEEESRKKAAEESRKKAAEEARRKAAEEATKNSELPAPSVVVLRTPSYAEPLVSMGSDDKEIFITELESKVDAIIQQINSFKEAGMTDQVKIITDSGIKISLQESAAFDEKISQTLEKAIASGIPVSFDTVINGVSYTVEIPAKASIKLSDFIDANGRLDIMRLIRALGLRQVRSSKVAKVSKKIVNIRR